MRRYSLIDIRDSQEGRLSIPWKHLAYSFNKEKALKVFNMSLKSLKITLWWPSGSLYVSFSLSNYYSAALSCAQRVYVCVPPLAPPLSFEFHFCQSDLAATTPTQTGWAAKKQAHHLFFLFIRSKTDFSLICTNHYFWQNTHGAVQQQGCPASLRSDQIWWTTVVLLATEIV